MNKLMKITKAFALAVSILSILTGSGHAIAQTLSPSDVAVRGELATVVRVVDATTLDIKYFRGETATVKYAGIVVPNATQNLATQLNTQLARGQRIVVENDSFGNGAKNIYRLDGRFIGEELVLSGLAKLDDTQKNSVRAFELSSAQVKAQNAKRGIWANGVGQTVTLDYQRLQARQNKLPELAGLQNGQRVTIHGVTLSGQKMSGEFIYRPVGSAVGSTPLYARWKDGFVAIRPNADGVLMAYYQKFYPRGFEFTPGLRPRIVNERHQPTIEKLVPDGDGSNVLRIPGNALLLRRETNGSFTTIVDMFEYVSGDMPDPE
jgi:endonuclease YncB( thermonuclease family)